MNLLLLDITTTFAFSAALRCNCHTPTPFDNAERGRMMIYSVETSAAAKSVDPQ
jgi:hypothetical protein